MVDLGHRNGLFEAAAAGRALLAETGFGPVHAFQVPDDPLDTVYVARRPGAPS
ncbi:hypothetical protein [Allosalinactinospora lopnorensis]|uniref:hypothetical protein n=1 Tax=Allosalinactinospora lopnorensis TaxID=1352348 RepID=UPI0012E2CC8F|nr:hypothetical protein [Allosalinactinospora lopnorensis]